jgi:hypothetical protein
MTDTTTIVALTRPARRLTMLQDRFACMRYLIVECMVFVSFAGETKTQTKGSDFK